MYDFTDVKRELRYKHTPRWSSFLVVENLTHLHTFDWQARWRKRRPDWSEISRRRFWNETDGYGISKKSLLSVSPLFRTWQTDISVVIMRSSCTFDTSLWHYYVISRLDYTLAIILVMFKWWWMDQVWNLSLELMGSTIPLQGVSCFTGRVK